MNQQAGFQVSFQPLCGPWPALTLPCDAAGHVQLDALSDGDRHEYLFARVVMGREYAAPQVIRLDQHR